jgi:uncharacterized membrane protein YeaQ/YmgE (transglycosylase-associated protein family)
MDINHAIHNILSTPYIASILSWVCFGLVAGVAAKLILPGEESMGWLRTIVVGILGAFIGGIGASMMGYNVNIGWNILGFCCAVIGSVVLLLLNRIVTRS